ncbi:two pore domain potassium channel family protein [Nocardioides sp. zg-536]|uniref:Two pore domain potassium channel family protein n=1 Tax=Nocardioides faecalis TaxID=2803858 RepID=A0A939BX05_9ACTN|nr:potassium channel family protein [Nocardioides faecalis]MBM9458305.1 two pore domain potassium channel family protein [Nocardioides faecalis]MBS4753394.1 two pore domain potassium channel family protein [Nocardioides faecalis]QVI58333.1 two pore domain potassium channel family protein [Nocardioides faecalis]
MSLFRPRVAALPAPRRRRIDVEQWERRSEVPLILLALAFLVAYAWPVLDPRIDADLRLFLTWVSWAVWVAFAADLLIRLVLAQDRRRYALSHWYDVALVALPLLRPLRLLRLLALVRILDRSASSNLAGRVLVYVSGATSLAVLLGSLAVLDAERDADGANLTTFGDAIWWACATVTTVGYGDRFPVTLEGRLVAGVLMVVGIGLVGTVTATVATWILGRVAEEQAAHRKASDETDTASVSAPPSSGTPTETDELPG